MVEVSESGLADTVENTETQIASTIKIAILFFMVASLITAPDHMVAIKIPTYSIFLLQITYFSLTLYSSIIIMKSIRIANTKIIQIVHDLWLYWLYSSQFL